MSSGKREQVEIRRTNRIKSLFGKLLGDPMGAIGVLIVASFLIIALFADVIAPYEPNKIDILNKLQGPSLDHLVGTDQLGRDTLSRLIHGTQIALLVAAISIGLAVLIGSVLGAIAGYGPTWLDFIIMLIFDTMRSYPVIMFALAVVVLFGPSLTTIIIIIMATSFPTYGRLMRTQTQTLRKSEYILSAQALGISTPRILLRHILPNTIGPILIVASMDVPFVIALEAGLSFLGLGVRPPTPSWGSILNDGFTYIRNSPWILFSAGAPLILVTIGFTFLGEQLRDVLDPKISKDR
ncbi:MAG: ABC transporter permease [Alphaproteobacteria bacterium]|jgi:peptide/nickel transport system permease protein|nr:ABC transporter permease [Alphaproteobacteria bacterium]MDG2466693.1 ABC transporter permease [Alphaproteobacteria bacterium]